MWKRAVLETVQTDTSDPGWSQDPRPWLKSFISKGMAEALEVAKVTQEEYGESKPVEATEPCGKLIFKG